MGDNGSIVRDIINRKYFSEEIEPPPVQNTTDLLDLLLYGHKVNV